jgi:hypothetical protein
MSPNGRVVAFGRYPYWTARIRPFFDSDEERDILFYQTDRTTPGELWTVFSDTFWLKREAVWLDGVGTVIGSERVAPGASHPKTFGVPIGRPEWFTEGISHAALLRGDYGPGVPFCTPVEPRAQVSRVAVEVVRPVGPARAEVDRVAIEVVRAQP